MPWFRGGLATNRRIVSLQLLVAVAVTVPVTVALVAVNSGNVVYDLPIPEVVFDFPTTMWYDNSGQGGVCDYVVSFRLKASITGWGWHRAVPSAVFAMISVTDRTLNEAASWLMFEYPFVVWEAGYISEANATLPIESVYTARANQTQGAWCDAGWIYVDVAERPDAQTLWWGVGVNLMIPNLIAMHYDGHRMVVRVTLTLIYARWWAGFRISPLHQQQSVTYDLGDGYPSPATQIYLLPYP